jgi:alkyl hydroperoxide reductase subunit F
MASLRKCISSRAGSGVATRFCKTKSRLPNVYEVLKQHQLLEIHGRERVEGLTVKNLATGEERRLDVEGVFIEVGLYPNTDFLLDLVETNERGEVKVDRHGQTGVRGIFAAGDATDGHDKQIVIAAGEGAAAALAAFEYLVKQV